MSRILSLLVRLLPEPYRQEFGAEIEAAVRADYQQASERGRWPGLQAFAKAAGDLLVCALKERVSPTWGPRAKGQHELRSLGREWRMGFGRDVSLALRSMIRSPMFALVTVVTLGVAIGGAAGIFNVVKTVVLDPLPYEAPDRLVYIASSVPGSDFPPEFPSAREFYVQYDEQVELLESVGMFNSFTATVRADDRVERPRVSFMTNSMFDVLGAVPVLGRLPEPEEESRAFVMSHGMWVRWFGEDPDVIGRTLDVVGEPRTVVGVMGPEFRFPNDGVHLWIPFQVRPEEITPGRFGAPMVGRMTAGVTPDDLRAQLDAVVPRLPERFGGGPAYARIIEQHRSVVRPIRDEILGPVTRPLWVLMGAVVLLYLIACANCANLFLVRGERHQRDAALRQAMGAGRSRIMRGRLTEAAVIALAAGTLGLIIAAVGAPLLLQAAPADIPRGDLVGLDWGTAAFVGLLSVLAGIGCGIVPALRAAGASLQHLRDGGRGSTRRLGRNGLVVAQTALALVLLTGSGLLLRSFRALSAVDPGYDTSDVFSFQIAPEEEHLTDGPSFAQFHVGMMERLAALPGVESVGLVENLPLNESPVGSRFLREDEAPGEDSGSILNYTFAGGRYFRTMGISVLAGRTFADGDHRDEVGNVVLSRAAADALWPGQDPVGRRLTQEESAQQETVIGVVEDVMQSSFRTASPPLLYRPMVGPEPLTWELSSPAYVVKTARAETIAPEVRALVGEMAPSAPMYRVFTMEGLAADSMAELSFMMSALSVAAALSLFLGALGLYGVLSYVVALRTQEIGVRMTLGARANEVRRMVVSQGVSVVALGIGAGLVLAVLTTRALATLLFGVAPLDPSTFAAVTVLMLVIGFSASYLPARRASNVDPIVALHAD